MTVHLKLLFIVICVLKIIFLNATNDINRPHIIFILADDLGWNDVSFHGSSQIPTPNIDALAFSGIILNRYYVTPICTPSRSSLMTGKYAIHTGMQHTVLYGAEPRGLPLNETLLPEYLTNLGYSSHIVGKWHLGHYKQEYTPLYRGFKSHTGYWTGHHDYYDHTAVEKPSWGLDIRRGLDVAYDLHGKYTTHIITDESIRIIKQHNKTIPMFLYVSHAAVHSGNPYNPLPAPDDTVAKFNNIGNFNRRKYAAMVSELDISVGKIIKELGKQNMLQDSIIIFSTDNGGPADGFNLNAASNWPLRGVKNTLWEGGIRGAGLIWSPLLEEKSRVSNQMMHITDWLPTLYSAAGGDIGHLKHNLDGIDMWPQLSSNTPSERKDVLHNIDDIWGSASLMIDNWKVIKGTNYNGQWDSWYGPAGIRGTYNNSLTISSDAGIALMNINMFPNAEQIKQLRDQANVKCGSNRYNLTKEIPCKPLKAPCLFNVLDDPCELFNLADMFPNILETLLRGLDAFNRTAVPPGNLPLDGRGDPRLWGNTWTNFGDYSICDSYIN